jgi:hypothetical protein
MTRDEFLNIIQEAISPHATLQDGSFNVERASGQWTRTYTFEDGVVKARNHKNNWQDQRADTFEDPDVLLDNLWEYSGYKLYADHYQDGSTSIARPA